MKDFKSNAKAIAFFTKVRASSQIANARLGIAYASESAKWSKK
jgi:hypothetical protein